MGVSFGSGKSMTPLLHAPTVVRDTLDRLFDYQRTLNERQRSDNDFDVPMQGSNENFDRARTLLDTFSSAVRSSISGTIGEVIAKFYFDVLICIHSNYTIFWKFESDDFCSTEAYVDCLQLFNNIRRWRLISASDVLDLSSLVWKRKRT